MKFAKAFDNQLTLPFAFFISVWGVLYVQWWKRRNMFLVIQWNMSDFTKEERPRPSWKGTRMKMSRVTGKLEPHFPWLGQQVLHGFSTIMVIFLLIIMIVSVESYILYNAWVSYFLRTYHPELAYIASFTSAAISLITSMILGALSRWISQK